MPAAIITTEDLQTFREQLLEDIQKMLKANLEGVKPKDWMRSTDVMDHLNISHATLQNLRNGQKIPSYKIEGLIYYDREEIDDIISQRRLLPLNLEE
ncbi:MAG: helix-turn-helix domain-containing protein [Bacteroidota bacterium]